MKALVIHSAKDLRLEEKDPIAPKADELLIDTSVGLSLIHI